MTRKLFSGNMFLNHVVYQMLVISFADTHFVKLWYKESLAGKLYGNIPADGVVVKLNSVITKQRLGVNSKRLNFVFSFK